MWAVGPYATPRPWRRLRGWHRQHSTWLAGHVTPRLWIGWSPITRWVWIDHHAAVGTSIGRRRTLRETVAEVRRRRQAGGR